ncbi:MAG: epoxyqueuosine reductase [Candidatus Thorarchaeota archaeon]|jgi:epoxyqueuosine reductase QueG
MNKLTENLRQMAFDVGFSSIGITTPAKLSDLPYGWVGKIKELFHPEEKLPSVKSVVLLAFHAWDSVFSLNIDSPNWRGYGLHSIGERFDSYYFGIEIIKNKAWTLVDYLRRRGYDAFWSFDIPFKTAAVEAGLGWQGKNTLLITPEYGPRIKLISILTDAELEPDVEFKENHCGDCEKCITACPTKALEPYKLTIEQCITYSVESPCTSDVSDGVRKVEKRLTKRPTPHSFIECTKCIDACPIGREASRGRFTQESRSLESEYDGLRSVVTVL